MLSTAAATICILRFSPLHDASFLMMYKMKMVASRRRHGHLPRCLYDCCQRALYRSLCDAVPPPQRFVYFSALVDRKPVPITYYRNTQLIFSLANLIPVRGLAHELGTPTARVSALAHLAAYHIFLWLSLDTNDARGGDAATTHGALDIATRLQLRATYRRILFSLVASTTTMGRH